MISALDLSSIGGKTFRFSSGLVLGEDDHERVVSHLKASKIFKELVDEKACGCNCHRVGGGRVSSHLKAFKFSILLWEELACCCNCHALVDSSLDGRITNLADTKRRQSRGEYDCELGRNFMTKEECSKMIKREKMEDGKER